VLIFEGHDHAASELAHGDAREIEGRPCAGQRFFGMPPVGLDTADASANAGWQDLDGLAIAERAIDQGAGDDCTETRHGKGAIDREARLAHVTFARGRGENGVDGGDEGVDAGAC
jgi:hypothetical protein